MEIPFNKPFVTGEELNYVRHALESGGQSGNNYFGKRVVDLMKDKYGFEEVFLTPSCTAALEMGVLLAGIKPGDEVIMPSYTFSSTANAVYIFGGVPVFCEVSPDSMNIEISKIESLITAKTKMIIPIDYAGVSCDIEGIMQLAEKYNLVVMQDCAQSYGTIYRGKPSGTVPHLACFSFHETKNYSSGEGGALIVNVHEWKERASYLQEKGTDRSKVLEGEKSRYSWIDKGSSYLLSDILAAILLAQLEAENLIKNKRKVVTRAYREILRPYEINGFIKLCSYGDDVEVNHHAFWILLDSGTNRDKFAELLKAKQISAYIGYVPLHSSRMGTSLGYTKEDLPLTEEMASRIIRLPLYTELADEGLEYCCEGITNALEKIYH